MLWRIAARIVTGPLAFLTAGVIDLLAFVVSWIRLPGRAVRRAD